MVHLGGFVGGVCLGPVLDLADRATGKNRRWDTSALLLAIGLVVAAWAGAYGGKTLTYAKPGHPEHRVYKDPEAIIVTAK